VDGDKVEKEIKYENSEKNEIFSCRIYFSFDVCFVFGKKTKVEVKEEVEERDIFDVVVEDQHLEDEWNNY
jgi:hypothetical protein